MLAKPSQHASHHLRPLLFAIATCDLTMEISVTTPTRISGQEVTTATTAQTTSYQAASLSDYGAVGDGVTDDTAAVQAAVDACIASGRTLFCPAGKYKLTSTVNVGGEIQMVGDGYGVNRGAGAPGTGTWFYLAHTGAGFSLVTTQQGGMFRAFGTYRAHAQAGAGWSPTIYDYDFKMSDSANEWTFRDLMLLNPYKGIYCSNRPTIDKVKMQAFKEGICIDNCRDTARLIDVHIWPFWSEDTHVAAYTIGNLDAFRFLRCDNPTMVGCFSIWHRRGISIENGASGNTYIMRASCCDFDAGQNGIVIEGTVNGATLYLDNIATQGAYDYTTAGIGLQVAGSNCSVIASGFVSFDHAQGLIRVDGTGNSVIVFGADLRNWDRPVAGYPAVHCAAGSYCAVWDYHLLNSYNSTSAWFDGPIKTKHNKLVRNPPGDIQADFTHAGEAVIMGNNHYFYLPSNLPDGTTITVINVAGSGGNAYIAPVSGVTLYRNGASGNVTVGPGSATQVIKASSASWIAL